VDKTHLRRDVSQNAGPPRSVCSEPCLQGHVKSFTVRPKIDIIFHTIEQTSNKRKRQINDVTADDLY